MNFIIKTHFSGVVYQKPCLFVLNKGLNSGKPQFEPFTNSFVIIFEKQEDRENLYYVAYSLWRSKYWLQHLVGSVIPFLRIKDFKHEFSVKAKVMMEEHEAHIKHVAALKLLDAKEKQFHENLNLINDLQRSIMHRFSNK